MNAIAENQNRGARGSTDADRGFVTPPANISATQNEYVIELEMPGVNREGLEITVEGNELTIVGRRQPQEAEGELCYCESAQANFRRVFEFGPDVDPSKIDAHLEQGVLKLRLPKSEKARPRQ